MSEEFEQWWRQNSATTDQATKAEYKLAYLAGQSSAEQLRWGMPSDISKTSTPAAEPVATVQDGDVCWNINYALPDGTKLYTRPAKEWKPIDIIEMAERHKVKGWADDQVAFAAELLSLYTHPAAERPDHREAMQMALDALEYAAYCVQNNYLPDACGHDWDNTITALKEALK